MLLPVLAFPDGYSNWKEYIDALPRLKGIAAVPVFSAARKVLGPWGIAVIGGLVSLPISSTKQIPVYLVMPDHTLVKPTSYSTGFTYTGSGLPSGTSVSVAGVVSSGTTAGDGEVTIAYTDGENEFSCPVNVSVVSAP